MPDSIYHSGAACPACPTPNLRPKRHMPKAEWRTGSTALKEARQRKSWPDGAPIGRGFAAPYLQSQYAAQIGAKQKTVEGRPGGGWLVGITTNDWINFKVTKHAGHGLAVRVRRVRHYKSFERMIIDVGVENLLPDCTTFSLDDAVQLYRGFANGRGSYGKLEGEYGAVAIDVEPLEPTVEPIEPFSDGRFAQQLQPDINSPRAE